MPKPTAYWDYIKVEELSLQGGLAEIDASLSNDEVMFITAPSARQRGLLPVQLAGLRRTVDGCR